MKKQLIQKGAIVVIVLLLFVAFIQYREYKNTHFAVDQKTFHVKNSMDQIMQDIYQEYPSLSLEDAFHYGVGVDVSKDIPLVNERRDIKIDKVWLNFGNIFLLYSVDLLKGDKSLKEIPSLKVGKIIMHRDNGPDFIATMDSNDLSPKKGMETYNHRVYQHFLKAYNLSNVTFTSVDDVKHFKENYLDHVTSITLDNVKMVLGKKETALNNIKLPVSFNFDKYSVKTIPINKEIHLGDTLVKIKDYQKFFDHGELNYEAVNGSSNIINMIADVKVNGKNVVNWDKTEGIPKEFILVNGKQYFPNIKAKSITITPNEYGFKDSTPIKIHIDKSQMETLNKRPNSEIKVADIKNGSIFISFENMANQGVYGFELIFKYDDQKSPHIGHMNWITTGELKNILEDQKAYVLMSQVIDIKNEKGHLLNTFTATGVENGTGIDIYHFDGDMIDWFEFSGLNITLQSLKYVNKITVDPITVPLGK